MKQILFLFLITINCLPEAKAQVMAQAALPTFQTQKNRQESLRKADAIDQVQFNKEYDNFVLTLEQNFVFREKVIDFLQKYPTGNRKGQTYQNWVYQIIGGANFYLDTRKEFLDIATKYSVYEDLWGNPDVPLLTKKKMMLAVAAALQIYDNYFSVVNLAAENSDIRLLLNQGDETNHIPKGIMTAISKQANSWLLRIKLASQVQGYDRFLSAFPRHLVDDQIYYLSGVIAAANTYPIFRKNMFGRAMDFAEIRLNGYLRRLDDTAFSALPRYLTNLLSKGFGNFVGMMEERKGKLHPSVQPGLAEKLAPRLKPLDILLEKTPFRLTDRFIPGHWGHVAIWIGSRQQLEQEGLWDLVTDENRQPAWKSMSETKRRRIVEALSSGHVILEALRPGVQLNSLEHFLNIDDFLAIRPDYVQDSLERRAELIALALTHFEKEYDFNFDVKTSDKIVCSELAYWTFPDIKWRTETSLEMTLVLARQSISPDNIIETVLKRPKKFSAIALFHDGQEVADLGRKFRNELCSLQKDSTLNHTETDCR